MAARVGAVQRRGVVGVREDLSDMIYNVDPTGFVFMQHASTGPRINQTLYEWQTDVDRAGSDSNRVEEGRVTEFSRPSTTRRLANVAQIAEESLSISGTMEAVTRIAGRGGRESTRLLMKKMRELQRDMELSFWRNGAAANETVAFNAIDDPTPVPALASDSTRTMGGLRAFIKTNFASVGTAGANDAITNSTAVKTAGLVSAGWSNTPTIPSGSWIVGDVVLGNLDEGDLRDILVSCYNENEVEMYDLVVGPQTKVRLSGFDGIADKEHNVTGSTKPVVPDTVDYYYGDFHTVRFMASRHVYPVDAFLMDWDSLEIRYFRPVGTKRLADRGDSKEWLINVEYGLAVKNERALGAFTDINPTTSRV